VEELGGIYARRRLGTGNLLYAMTGKIQKRRKEMKTGGREFQLAGGENWRVGRGGRGSWVTMRIKAKFPRVVSRCSGKAALGRRVLNRVMEV